LGKLAEKDRLFAVGNTLTYVRYVDDFPVTEYNNVWDDTVRSTYASAKIYVVQTSEKVVQRCLLMTTNPRDLVLEPTCGSGTTAYVAEQWGRRWITCDTSRVAATLAKQRLMTSQFDYFELAHPEEGVKSGFNYKIVPHVTLKSLANNETLKQESLFDQPIIERNKVRVTGPFTVEAVPCLRIKPFNGKEPKLEGSGIDLARMGETGQQAIWRDELKSSGIRAVGGKTLNFSRVEPMAATRFLHAEGEILDEKGHVKKAVISFGPQFGPLEQRQVEGAVKEARELKSSLEFIIFAAFHFDPEAAKDIDQMNDSIGQFIPGAKILKAQMSVDLLTHDLRKKRSSNQSYWLIGQPEVEVKKVKDGRYKVKVNGFDYYDPVSGEILSGSNKHIAMWFLDTDYDERSLMPDQVFFPAADANRDWTKLSKAMNGEVDEDLLEAFRGTESLEFDSGSQRKIAVKIIDNRGIESFVVKSLQ
jgi:adenine-specific DNA-methyltransferase